MYEGQNFEITWPKGKLSNGRPLQRLQFGIQERVTRLEERDSMSKPEVVEIEGKHLSLTNLDKVLYPRTGFTKGDVIAYYAAIAPVLLGHLADRPLTVTRWPDGVQAKSFFQKQAPAHRPEWVRTATVASASKPIDYTLADDLPTLVWLANLAAIELHVPLARAEAIGDRKSVV